ncbi:hypothetical protein N7512_006839 [Penicillium capsulatum]|nr:hypothetical protein N7512_006839 [Penicillium capsulatum]
MQCRSWSKSWAHWRRVWRWLLGRRHRAESNRPTLAERSSLSRFTPPVEISLRALPPPIVQRVFDYLPIPDEACLALTCKRFHGWFKSVFQHTDLRSPTRVAIEHRPHQMELLLRLESSSWRYCMKCLTLHRLNESSPGIDPGPGARSEVPNAISSTAKRQVSPCATMTRWQRFQLMRKLESHRVQHSDNSLLLGGMRFYCTLSDQGHHMVTMNARPRSIPI